MPCAKRTIWLSVSPTDAGICTRTLCPLASGKISHRYREDPVPPSANPSRPSLPLMFTSVTGEWLGIVDCPWSMTAIRPTKLTACPPAGSGCDTVALVPGGATTKEDLSDEITCQPAGTVLTLKPTGWAPVY